MDKFTSDAVTINDCFRLDRTEGEVFWEHFDKRKWFKKVQLLFPDDKFEIKEFNRIKLSAAVIGRMLQPS